MSGPESTFHDSQRIVDLWRGRLIEAREKYDLAVTEVKTAAKDFTAGTLPAPSTLWRWLHEDAIRPWYHRSWIFPKDPNFVERAGRLLDLYSREWQGKPCRKMNS